MAVDLPRQNDKGQWVVHRTCSQCGKAWDLNACGPTHAMIAVEIEQGKTVTE